MRDNNAVPTAAGNLGGQNLSPFASQVLFCGDKELGVGVKLHELARELLKEMIGYDKHRLLNEAGLLQLHAGSRHRKGLSGADGVSKKRVATTHAAPDGITLV